MRWRRSLIDLFLILANKQQNGVLGLHPFKNEALASTRFMPSPLARRWVLHRLHTTPYLGFPGLGTRHSRRGKRECLYDGRPSPPSWLFFAVVILKRRSDDRS